MLPNNQVRVPRARVVTQSAVRDITTEFTNAASKLKTGQLVKDETFTLFEAVGALELTTIETAQIMDSKMDSGYIAPGENLAGALEDDYDVRRPLTPEEVIGLMDQLLCHEVGEECAHAQTEWLLTLFQVAWHKGHPLSQTLFTSIYLDKLLWPVPRNIDDARFDRVPSDSPLVNLVLRAYCLALVKACDLVHGRVATEYYYEEEDFVSQLYNRNLLSAFNMSHFHRLLEQAVAWIVEQSDIDQHLKDAIICRLVFRREFLYALDQDLEVLETRSTKSFASCLSQLGPLTETVSLGKPIPEAFSLKIQRKLASTVPPRPMVHINSGDALEHLKRLCQDAIDMQQMLDYTGPSNFKTAVWTLLSRKPQPSIYIRCLLQALIVSNMTILGAVPVKEFLYDELAELVLPANILIEANTDEVEMPSDPRFQIAQKMDGFMKRFAQPFVDTVRCACLNRCRIRRTLCHTLVDWDNLQIEAEEIDLELRTLSAEPPLQFQGGEPTWSFPLSSWAYHQKLIQFRLILQMGFELSIYSPEELPGMYWYLSHICSTHLGHIDRIRTFMVAARKRDLMSTGDRAGSSPQKASAFHRSFHTLERLTTHIIAVDAFAIALHALYVVLARHNVLPIASSPQAYSTDRLRYEIRMKPFIPITLPELVPYEEYQREAALEGDSDVIILERASKAITEARKAWEATLANGAFIDDLATPSKPPPSAIEEDWKRDVKNTMRACIGTSLAIEAVKKALSAASSTEAQSLQLEVAVPEVGSKSRWHDWWVVPQVSEKKSKT
ncbi:NatC N(alpha)-terminal acetyltransferase Mak10 subunit [Penicillium paradoxum]|uniref:NatC N(alpha)-terminal acetyltransferase Mak10 subunit n=1 Tax=Penicillium paradoxum TaxID=176176 RepID=UPI002548C28A|nr:NatC N(alpha)-terminal acetyltransferase Mak10 subunit [Penicillium paradoxum]KAJ5788742.1 NatC N(alpha)-terminal acetyltransferase Mak10 subunit [Penicillium paradoxum]